ncbi:hypothetical protein Lesp02_57510 [Lentzea sp. NBRC 105346]|uniref:hypothetical protein n=1 Tax=Lentzea sp. NBRC 105346 TaxID=3032205 RepID=UPI0024A46FCC|nr:hypothetical protein [Lentzea sp. NBRC 105346]GLZ33563.1 hypothetical protein Lesp02_57510 [Lentzea sp. NBRC 105346]
MFTRILVAVSLIVAVAPASASASARGWTPTPSGVEKGDITAVAALDAQRAWAVGYRLVSDNEARPVALRWNGSSWAQESELPRDSFPFGLEVRSPSDIWTIGDGVQHWNGSTWSAASFPPASDGYFMPESLDSVPSGQAWVVGRLVNDSVKDQHPVAYAWNGTAWSRVSLPDLGIGALQSVVAVAPNNIWAAGFAAGTPQTSLVVHFDGVSWQRVSSPSVPGAHTWISGLYASGGELFAVGGSNSGAADRPFAARWDGRQWAVTRTPPIADGRLRAVTATGDGSVYAVGGKGAVTVLLRYHPVLRAWTRVSAPDLVVRGFSGVPGSSGLWAVGISHQGDLVPVITRTR